jgi:hypothetical protein
MVCRRGGIRGSDVGAIRVARTFSTIAVSGTVASAFEKATREPDPRDPKVLYGCGFENSAWRSRDRGATWERIRGYNFKWGHRVVPDPRDARMIYVTTFGGSVWHGPADGDPRAVEDIVTPVAAHGRK